MAAPSPKSDRIVRWFDTLLHKHDDRAFLRAGTRLVPQVKEDVLRQRVRRQMARKPNVLLKAEN